MVFFSRIYSIPAIALTFMLLSPPQDAFGFIGGNEYRIGQFCESKSLRRTIVYIDQALMTENDVEWARRLRTKLLANLLPSEPVELIRLDPTLGQSKEIWKRCFPDYKAEQVKKLESETYIIRENPLKILKKQQEVFESEFLNALTSIYEQYKKPKVENTFSFENAPKKNIIRALMSDESRFSHRNLATRVLIYTDALENSGVFDSFSNSDGVNKGKDAAKKYGINFGQSIFYVYGVGRSLKQPGDAVSTAKAFWDSFLKSANGHLNSFGIELNTSTSKPVNRLVFNFEVSLNRRLAVGLLSLTHDRDGNLQDSFVSISGQTGAAIEGTFKCSVSKKCTLEANTRSDFLTTYPREKIILEGPPNEMRGHLSVPNAYLESNPEQPAKVKVKAKIK